MADIRWNPDENGVPWCGYPNCPLGNACECDCDTNVLHSDEGDAYCYPAIVKIVKAAKQVASSNSPIGELIQAVSAYDLRRLQEALSHE